MKLSPLSDHTKPIRPLLLYLLFCVLALLSGCLDVIDVKVPDSEKEILVIQGKLIIGQPSFAQLRISRLFDFTPAGKRPVNARSVVLYSEDGQSIELEDDGLGNYSLYIPADDPDFTVALNKNYWVRIETFDGRTFESKPEKGNAVPRAESLDFELYTLTRVDSDGFTRSQEMIRFLLNTPLRSSGAGNELQRVGWQSEWTFKVLDSPFEANVVQKTCYVTQALDVTGIKVVDSDELLGDYLSGYAVYENAITRNFAEGLVYTAIQESLSEDAYTYFSQIAQNVNRTGNMFESPPGAVISNMRNLNDEEEETYGFFYVTEQDTIRKYIRPADVGNPPLYCPPPGGLLTQSGLCADFICCDCSSVDNSTTEVPDFWEE